MSTRAMIGAAILLFAWAAPSNSTESQATAPYAISHVGISVADMERSLAFYRDLLGMQVAVRLQVDNNPVYDHILGLKNTRVEIAVLSLGSMSLELFEFKRPRGQPAATMRPPNDHGFNHVCFEVSDIQQQYERLRRAGVPFQYPPQTFPSGNQAAYARDPDGNLFELRQLANRDGR